MGFRFRRSLGFVPGLRLNLSRSGPSVSLGTRGLHYTIGLKGTRSTLGIPGSGLSWTSYRSYSSQSPLHSRSGAIAPPPADVSTSTPIDSSANVFQNTQIEQMAAASTSDLAPILNSVHRKWRLSSIILKLTIAAIAIAVLYNSLPFVIGAVVFGLITWPTALLDDRKRLTVTLEYYLVDDQAHKFTQLIEAFKELSTCKRLWRVPIREVQRDWKRHAGAGFDVEREKISCNFGLPRLIKSNLLFPFLQLGRETIYFTPDTILIFLSSAIAVLRYDEFEASATSTRFIEAEGVPADSETVGETWKFVNKEGGADRRFANNRKLPICRYGELVLRSDAGLNQMIQSSQVQPVIALVAALIAMRRQENDSMTSPVVPEKSIPPILHPTAPLFEGRIIRKGLDAPSNFAKESERARALIQQRDKFWEFRLAEELLKEKSTALRIAFDESERVPSTTSEKQFNDAEYLFWMKGKFGGLGREWAMISCSLNRDLPTSMADPGDSSDAMRILEVIESAFDHCRSLLTIAQEIGASYSPSYDKWAHEFYGYVGRVVVGDISQYAEEWGREMKNLQNGSREFEVKTLNQVSAHVAKLLAHLPEATAQETAKLAVVFQEIDRVEVFQRVVLK